MTKASTSHPLDTLNNKTLNSEIETKRQLTTGTLGCSLSITRLSILRLKPSPVRPELVRPRLLSITRLSILRLKPWYKNGLTEAWFLLSITRLSILRLKHIMSFGEGMDETTLNNKTLNSEIETSVIPLIYHLAWLSLNNKTLNSEIETVKSSVESFGFTYSLNNKTLNSEIETIRFLIPVRIAIIDLSITRLSILRLKRRIWLDG